MPGAPTASRVSVNLSPEECEQAMLQLDLSAVQGYIKLQQLKAEYAKDKTPQKRRTLARQVQLYNQEEYSENKYDYEDIQSGDYHGIDQAAINWQHQQDAMLL